VRLPSYLQRTDTELAEEVVQALQREPVLPLEDVKAAERALRRLAGIRAVSNELAIKARSGAGPIT
jgi:hypothetical protein